MGVCVEWHFGHGESTIGPLSWTQPSIASDREVSAKVPAPYISHLVLQRWPCFDLGADSDTLPAAALQPDYRVLVQVFTPEHAKIEIISSLDMGRCGCDAKSAAAES